MISCKKYLHIALIPHQMGWLRPEVQGLCQYGRGASRNSSRIVTPKKIKKIEKVRFPANYQKHSTILIYILLFYL